MDAEINSTDAAIKPNDPETLQEKEEKACHLQLASNEAHTNGKEQ